MQLYLKSVGNYVHIEHSAPNGNQAAVDWADVHAVIATCTLL